MTTTSSTSIPPADEIIAKPGKSYRVRRYLMVLLLIGAGIWFWYDGYYRYPQENERIRQINAALDQPHVSEQQREALATELKRLQFHNNAGLLLQRVLGYSLPVIGVVFLIFTLHQSRGEYRLKEQIIYVPGHPPVPFGAIRELDKRAWDRKGIAYVVYEVDGQRGRLKLDDFLYDQDPTDAIYTRILNYVAPPAPENPESEEAKEEAQS